MSAQGPEAGMQRLRGYGLAAVIVAAAALLRWSAPSVLSGVPFLTFYPAVVAAAVFAGTGPGILATVASALCVGVLFDPTPGWENLGEPAVLIRLGLFLVGGIGTSLAAGALRASRATAHRQAEALEQSNAGLGTANERLQAANRELEMAGDAQRLQAAALEAAANGIAITDANGAILWVNHAFVAMTGYSAEEVIGQTHRLLKSGAQDEAFYRKLWETILRGEVWHGELVNRRKDGTLYVDEQSITPLKDAQGRITHFVAIKQDISARKQAEEALAAARRSSERAKIAAEDASKAKDHFLAVLSHELRTPLTPVATALTLLRQRPDLDDGLRETLEMAQRNVEMEARLIDDLLDVTRIARGKIELARAPVRLCTILERAVEVCRPDMESRGLHFGIDWGERPYWIHADPARLQQVFWNLLKNAVKFTPRDGCVGVRCRRVDGRSGQAAHVVVIEVIDSGVGIEPRMLGRVFDAFEQAERSITRQFGGLGLGLAISRALVELHEGRIEAHSEGPGKGARFCVRLPLLTAGAILPGPGEPAPAAPVEAAAVTPLRILLVEDHGDTAKVMRRLLETVGHQVRIAGDVATALALTGQDQFDLLLSDLGLPDASGLDLVRELRARNCTMPGIALSGYGQEQDIRRSYEAGFAAHLTKPTSLDQLTRTIRAVTQPGVTR